jgi:hypothetical protein
VYCFECVCVILCFVCIVVPLPPGTNPFAVNNSNNNANNEQDSKSHTLNEPPMNTHL